MSKLWRIWKYALGSFADERTKRYDNHVVLVRSIIFFSYLITNWFYYCRGDPTLELKDWLNSINQTKKTFD